MSFKAVWGFDPEEVERAKQQSKPASDLPREPVQVEHAGELAGDDGLEIPCSREAQVYALMRIYRL